ncbi:MAG TPA: cytochrome c-type biogenesis protein [Pyrinomonadaceae bacterium]|nr:cytochrome c-type biogenesis protein [Pyrinomonadaceae bacterium]
MKLKEQIANSASSVKLCESSVPLWFIFPWRNSPQRHREPQSFTERFLQPYVRRFGLLLAIVCGLLFWSGNPLSAKEAQPNEDPKIEQRMKNLTEQLRCLVCQNETLADSRADLAEDLRKQIREQMRAGKSDQEILAFLTERYGDFVLYKPPVKKTTYLLWFGPFVLLIAGTGVLYRYLKNRREMIQEKPLTAAERKRAEELLRNA